LSLNACVAFGQEPMTLSNEPRCLFVVHAATITGFGDWKMRGWKRLTPPRRRDGNAEEGNAYEQRARNTYPDLRRSPAIRDVMVVPCRGGRTRLSNYRYRSMTGNQPYGEFSQAVAGWDLHPLESAALSRRTPGADIDRPRNKDRVRYDRCSMDFPSCWGEN
jgi:hypothetical protein